MTATPDEKEQILSTAEAATRKAYDGTHAVDDLRKWKAAERALMEYRDGAATGRRFKNVAEVFRYLLKEGWNTTDRTVRNHARLNYLVETRGGGYLIDDVERYAQTYLHRPGGQAAAPQDNRDELVSEQVRKLRLANDIEEGRYVLRSEAEQRNAAAAAYLKNDLANFGPRIVQRLVEESGDLLRQIGVDNVNLAAIVPDLEAQYEKQLAAWLTRYAERAAFPEKTE